MTNTVELMDAVLAASGKASALVCAGCDNHFTIKNEARLTGPGNFGVICSVCGEKSSIYDADVRVLPSSASFLDVETTKAARWFHATTNAHWLDEITDADIITPLVHIGTKETALARAEDIMAYISGDIYLYELEFSSDVTIGDTFLVDEDDWETEANYSNYPAPAMRYVNKWEATGEISMIVDPLYLNLVRRSIVGQENIAA